MFFLPFYLFPFNTSEYKLAVLKGFKRFRTEGHMMMLRHKPPRPALAWRKLYKTLMPKLSCYSSCTFLLTVLKAVVNCCGEIASQRLDWVLRLAAADNNRSVLTGF